MPETTPSIHGRLAGMNTFFLVLDRALQSIQLSFRVRLVQRWGGYFERV